MVSFLREAHLDDLFIGDLYGLGIDLKSMQAFTITVSDMAFYG